MTDITDTPNPTLKRLEEQIAWYDKKSSYNQRRFKLLKISQIIAGALIPFAASVGAPAAVAGGLGVLIVIFEGLQSLTQHQQSWISYRSTWQKLTQEKYLWLAKAGPYESAPNPDAEVDRPVRRDAVGQEGAGVRRSVLACGRPMHHRCDG